MLISLKQDTRIFSFAAIGGKAEKEGPLGEHFDYTDETERFSQKTWEQAENEMQRLALSNALGKFNLQDTDIGLLFAGDLMNQCTASGYGLLSYDIPFVGLYGACSTAAESIALAAMASDNTGAICGAVTSSHFCTAERQYRFPLEYGGQRTPTSQRTVTGSAAFLIGRDHGGIGVCDIMFGRSVDSKIDDINNKGAAKAPAAVDTLSRYFAETGTGPADYDLIATGDLGKEGYSMTKLMMAQKGTPIDDVYYDCGLWIYNAELQDMHAGGSGCGCSAVTAATKILPEILSGKLKNVLFLGTGALMSPTVLQQGLPIVSIAHLVHFCGR